MDRSRDARRASVVGSNGFNRRRHRTNSLRDSPDEDGGPELQESVRLRERVKKDRDRDLRERGRERDLRERSSRSKRRRAADDTSDESVNDEEEDEDDQNLPGEGGRFSSPASGSVSNHHGGGHNTSFSQQPQQHNSNSGNLQHRKTFPPSSSSSTAKVLRPPPAWKPGDEMISASVPRKARSASTKRSHDWVSNSNNSGNNGDPNPPQPPISPAAPTSPSSSNAAVRKKPKHGPNINPGPKPKPPNASSSSAKPSSSNPEELEIEIAEVLYGLMTQSQGPPSSRDNAKSGNPLPISDYNPNHYNSNNPLSAVAPKRKRPRQVPEGPGPARTTPLSVKPETQSTEQTAKSEISSPPNPAAESISLVSEVVPTSTVKLDSESKDVGSSKELESSVARDQDMKSGDSLSTTIAPTTPKTINSNEDENRKEDKLEIDLMASPRQPRSSPERETKIDARASSVVDQKPALSTLDVDSKLSKHNEDENGKIASGNIIHLTNVEAPKVKESEPYKVSSLDFRLGLEKPERDLSSGFSPSKNKSIFPTQKNQQPHKSNKEEQQPLIEKPNNLSSSLPLTMPMASWPPPMGYMAPLQGVVTPAHIQPLFSQPRPKRCATHCHIARNIHCLQQFMKSNPFWSAPGGAPPAAASLFASKPCGSLSVVGPTTDLNISAKDKASIPSNGGKEKGSQQVSSSDSAQRKPQILIQQSIPSVAPTNLLGPAFIIPINQQQAAVRPASKSQSPSNTVVVSSSAAPTSAMSFNYPNMSPNETQYLAFLQNNPYPFTIPTVGPPLNYRGPPPPQAMPLFNGSFYSSPMMHQQLQQTSNQPPQMVQVHHNTNAGKLIQAPHNSAAGNNSSSSQKQKNFSQKAQWPPHGNHYVQGGGNDDNTPLSVGDNRGSRVNIYGQNFAVPIHPQSFALMTPNVHQAEKKSNSQPQQGMKVVESLPPHTFAMSFGPGMDSASMAQGHAMFQNCSESARQNMQMMAAAASAQKNNFRISEESKPGNSGNQDNSFGKEDERKIFTFADNVASSIQANNNVGLARNSRPATSNGSGTMNDIQNAQAQAQHQQQMMKLNHQQQQMAAANASNRTNKPPSTTSNGSIYSEHLNSSPVMGKFPNTVSPVFPQSLVQSSNTPSPSQSPQWKSSRTPSASLGSSSAAAQMMQHKNLPQQHSRSQPMHHAQISFGGSKKQQANSSQGAPSSSHQGPSSPMMVGSPTTSSLSKGTSGSPRTNSSASTTNNKAVGHHSSPFSSQPLKNSASILGNSKAQMQQQQKNMQQQAHLFFSNPYSQPPHLTSAGVGPGGYSVPQRRPDQHQRVPSGTSTNDPATAIAAATSSAKGVSTFGAQSTGTLLPAGYTYVQVKPAEQKQPSGNDSLHPEKK